MTIYNLAQRALVLVHLLVAVSLLASCGPVQSVQQELPDAVSEGGDQFAWVSAAQDVQSSASDSDEAGRADEKMPATPSAAEVEHTLSEISELRQQLGSVLEGTELGVQGANARSGVAGQAFSDVLRAVAEESEGIKLGDDAPSNRPAAAISRQELARLLVATADALATHANAGTSPGTANRHRALADLLRAEAGELSGLE